MKHAYVFPGQGAQAVGMGKDLYDNVPEAKELFEKANEILVAAQQRSRDMRKGANDFADDVLRSTEELLTKRVGELRQARQMLRNPLSKAEQSAPEQPTQPSNQQ